MTPIPTELDPLAPLWAEIFPVLGSTEETETTTNERNRNENERNVPVKVSQGR